MSRLSIDVTPEQKQRLKAMAAMQGKSIKDFVLSSTLGTPDEQAALDELGALLQKRLREAEAGGISKRTVEEIFEQAIRESRTKPEA